MRSIPRRSNLFYCYRFLIRLRNRASCTKQLCASYIFLYLIFYCIWIISMILVDYMFIPDLEELPVIDHICQGFHTNCMLSTSLRNPFLDNSIQTTKPAILLGQHLPELANHHNRTMPTLNIDVGVVHYGYVDISSTQANQTLENIFTSTWYHANPHSDSWNPSPWPVNKVIQPFTLCKEKVIFSLLQRFPYEPAQFISETLPRILAMRPLIMSNRGKILLFCSKAAKSWLTFLQIDWSRVICAESLQRSCNFIYATNVYFSRYENLFLNEYHLSLNYTQNVLYSLLSVPSEPIYRKYVIFLETGDGPRITNRQDLLDTIEGAIDESCLELVIFRDFNEDISKTIRLFQQAWIIIGSGNSAFSILSLANDHTHVFEYATSSAEFGHAYMFSTFNQLPYSLLVMSDDPVNFIPHHLGAVHDHIEALVSELSCKIIEFPSTWWNLFGGYTF